LHVQTGHQDDGRIRHDHLRARQDDSGLAHRRVVVQLVNELTSPLWEVKNTKNHPRCRGWASRAIFYSGAVLVFALFVIGARTAMFVPPAAVVIAFARIIAVIMRTVAFAITFVVRGCGVAGKCADACADGRTRGGRTRGRTDSGTGARTYGGARKRSFPGRMPAGSQAEASNKRPCGKNMSFHDRLLFSKWSGRKRRCPTRVPARQIGQQGGKRETAVFHTSQSKRALEGTSRGTGTRASFRSLSFAEREIPRRRTIDMQNRNRKAALLFASAGLAAFLAMPGAAVAQPAGTGATTSSGTSTQTTGTRNETQMQSGTDMNANGPNATDRAYGKTRACDRHQMHSGASTTDSSGMNMNCPMGHTMDSTPDMPDAGTTTPPSQ